MLEIRNLQKIYGNGATAVPAIGGLSFVVGQGELVCVVGPSGCGKTTTLKCLSGLMRATSGEVRLLGTVVQAPPPQMAVVFQDYSRSLMPWLSVHKNVELPLRRRRQLKRRDRARLVIEALAAVGLADAADRYPWQLSGGMQQRVAIARALAYQPEILLLDEPFASVDAQTRADLEDLLLQVRHKFGVTMLLVTHDIDEAVYLADRVVVLSPAPTRVREIVEVPMARPRNQVRTKADPAFARLRTAIYQTIKSDSGFETSDADHESMAG